MNNDYPKTVREVIMEVEYSAEVMEAAQEYAKAKPWAGDAMERRAKLETFHASLNRATGRTTELRVISNNAIRDVLGCYNPAADIILIGDKMSVVTYLHEYGHALKGSSEREACIWSINLFRKVFPKSFAGLRAVGHMLVKPEIADNRLELFETAIFTEQSQQEELPIDTQSLNTQEYGEAVARAQGENEDV